MTGCNIDSPPVYTVIKVVELKEFDTFLSEDNLMSLPIMLKYENSTDHLFICDLAQTKIFEKDSNGNTVVEYGGRGRGPGELQSIGNFFITKNYVYILDPLKYYIHKYNRKGDVVSSIDYGRIYKERYNQLPEKVPPSLNNISNDPFVTLNGNVLLPSHKKGKYLYELIDWEGNHLANVGEIPANYNTRVDKDKIRSSLENMQVPAIDLYRAFPIKDPNNSGEIFIIYSSIPKISKYDTTGQKLWEKDIPKIPELDSLTLGIMKLMDKPRGYLPPIRKYAWGKDSPKGDLYLATFTHTVTDQDKHLWIHKFSSKGELVQRYKVVHNSTLNYYPAINTNESQFLVVPFLSNKILKYPYGKN